jgi:predicted S18 family serine protease
MKNLILFSSIILFAGACASTKPPNQKLTQLEASIKQAEQVGAENYAPLEIREARKKLDKVRDLMNKEKYDDAKLKADEAMVDAELAQMKSLSEKAQKAVDQLRESIKALKQEIQHNLDKQGNQS